MKIIRNYKIMKKLNQLVTDDQFELKQSTNQTELASVKNSDKKFATEITFNANYSIDPKNLCIVVTETTYPLFLDKTIYVGDRTFYSIRLFDKQCKVLCEKDASSHGDLTELRSRLAKRVFKLLSNTYNKTK